MRPTHRAVMATVFAVGVSGAVSQPLASAEGAPLPVTGVSASADDGNVPANTLDGDLGTRWSAEGDGVWIQYDLGAPRTVGSVSIAWHKGDTRRHTFDVRLSGDGSSWRTVVARRTSGGTTLGPENHDFADSSARYLRVVGYGNTSNDWTSITETTVYGAEGGGEACDYPADVLDLTNWYIGLPVGEEEDPTNVEQPELDTYAIDPWFVATPDCAAVQFRAAVNGVTTSGSANPRSELREMTNSGQDKASWSSTSGRHTMTIDQAIIAVPEGRPYVVAGQIHDAEDDVSVFRLEGRKLYVTNGDSSDDFTLVTADYELGTRFQATFVVEDGQIEAYYNGELVTTIDKSFTGGYFKAGAYPQAHCGNTSPCTDDNYGEVQIYDLAVTHDQN